MAIGPGWAWFSTGTSSSAQPELNVPMFAMTDGSWAYALAFAEHVVESHVPACGVESSQGWKAMVYLPAFQPACSKIIWIAWFICVVWCDDDPLSGKSDVTSSWPLGFTTDLHVEELTGVAALPPPPVPPPVPLLLLEPLPQAAAVASTRTAANAQRARPGTRLICSPPTSGWCFTPVTAPAPRRATVYLPSPADEHKGSSPPTGRHGESTSSRRNATPRGRRRGGRGLWILRRVLRIQPKTQRLPQGLGRFVADVGRPRGHDDLLHRMAAEPDRRSDPRPVEHGPGAR